MCMCQPTEIRVMPSAVQGVFRARRSSITSAEVTTPFSIASKAPILQNLTFRCRPPHDHLPSLTLPFSGFCAADGSAARRLIPAAPAPSVLNECSSVCCHWVAFP